MNDITLHTYKDVISVATKKGVKIAVQNKADGPFIYVEKKDFLETIRNISANSLGPTDYDGNEETFNVYNDVIHVPFGVL